MIALHHPHYATRPVGPAKPRRVKFDEGEDFTCALLGSLGFSTQYIMQHTEFSPGQIGYRLRLGGIKRSDYRNGKSPMVTSIIQRARRVAIPEVHAHLSRVMKENQIKKEQAREAQSQLPPALTASIKQAGMTSGRRQRAAS